MGVDNSVPPAGLIYNQRNAVRDMGQSPATLDAGRPGAVQGTPRLPVSPADPGELC